MLMPLTLYNKCCHALSRKMGPKMIVRYFEIYKGDNKVVIVAINKNNTGVNQNFVLQNGTASQVSRWITSSSSNLQPGTDLKVTDNHFWAHLPAPEDGPKNDCPLL